MFLKKPTINIKNFFNRIISDLSRELLIRIDVKFNL